MAKYLRAASDVVARGRHQLGELAVDHLGGVEHRDEAHEVARQHAVEDQVDLLGRELDAGLAQRRVDLGLGGCDLVLVELDALLGLVDVLVQAVDGVGPDARQHAVLGRDDLLFLQLGDAFVELADVLAQALDLALHLDDGHVGDDAKGGIEQVADLAFAIFSRLGPERRNDELVLAGKLLGVAALLGGVLQDGIDGQHQAAGLLVSGIAFARIFLDGGLCRSGGRGGFGCRLRRRCLRPRRGALRFGEQAGDGVAWFERRRFGSGRGRPRNCGCAQGQGRQQKRGAKIRGHVSVLQTDGSEAPKFGRIHGGRR